MAKKALFALLAAFLLFGTGKTALADNLFQAGMDFSLGFPQTAFKEFNDRTGFGGTATFSVNLPRSPVSAGISLGFKQVGRVSWKEPLNPNIPEAWVTVSNSNNMVLTHFFLRLQPRKKNVRPYADFLFGFNYIFSYVGVSSNSGYDYRNDLYGSVLLDNFVLSYGAGCGMMVQVFSLREAGQPSFFIDIGIRYLKNGEADYLLLGSRYVDNGEAIYEYKTSTTDILSVRVGLTVVF